ncbi:hypothetical protein [Nocardioides acrostichi]|uniref:Lipoprotein n=1 Tax=Nocardioides acrostichi TaxID=2784339 RepID=A0A930Y6E6_9ACTN|nr:hypothetical protein [Nocardioides acrostichi]MBF4160897.1 hypothetical protein [Nocardioides acrostichi]
MTPRLGAALTLVVVALSGCSGDSDQASRSDPAEVTITGWHRGEHGGLEEPPATTCRGRMSGERVVGDLVVPNRATCRLDRVLVGGRTVVGFGSTLVSHGSTFGEGIGAHGFRRVDLLPRREKGRGPLVVDSAEDGMVVDFVFQSGSRLTITDGELDGRYLVLDMHGPTRIRGLTFDLGSLYCAGNDVAPDVSGISGESYTLARGQCAGRGAIDEEESDF